MWKKFWNMIKIDEICKPLGKKMGWLDVYCLGTIFIAALYCFKAHYEQKPTSWFAIEALTIGKKKTSTW